MFVEKRWVSMCLSSPRIRFQVESVFETLVEDSPEEESTLTSKMSMCTCVRVSLCAFQGGGQALPLGLAVESLLWCSLSLWVFLFLELGNTISSLFGGGSTPDTKENGTDTVQVRPGWSQGARRTVHGTRRQHGLGCRPQLLGM